MWLKGNLHAHTDRSDGDAPPDEVVAWYADNGFDFLAITDHNTLTEAQSESIVLIPGIEISLLDEGKPLHINALNAAAMPGLPGWYGDIARTLQLGVNAALSVGGLAMLNHPNFRWAFTEREMLRLEGCRLLEIVNTSTECNSFGGGDRPGVEQMWDALLTAGKRLYAVASDDMHDLKKPWHGHVSPPGRAWVTVRAAQRTRAAIMSALAEGDFYASTEIELDEIVFEPGVLRLAIRQDYDYAYTTHFIGAGGVMLAEAHGTDPAYIARGDEPYVRARVRSSNGGLAWTQPLWVG